MVQSTIKPAWYWLRNLKGTTAILRIRYALKEIAPPEDELADKESTPVRLWEYEEREITLTVPKPQLDAGALMQKTKIERYSKSDAIVVLARDHVATKTVITNEKTSIMSELGVKPNEIIAEAVVI